MEYLHSMLRVTNLEDTLDFFCNKLGMVETQRIDNEKFRFSLIFLSASHDVEHALEAKAPLLELTYNWPNDGEAPEKLDVGRSFGHLAYRVDNIYDTCQSLMNKGVVINRPPRDGHMAFIKSPDGISIELIQRDKPLELIEPWKSMENTGTW